MKSRRRSAVVCDFTVRSRSRHTASVLMIVVALVVRVVVVIAFVRAAVGARRAFVAQFRRGFERRQEIRVGRDPGKIGGTEKLFFQHLVLLRRSVFQYFARQRGGGSNVVAHGGDPTRMGHQTRRSRGAHCE